MTALLCAALLSIAPPQRLDLEPPPRERLALTIDPDEAERIQVNPWFAAPAAVLLGVPLTVNFLVGEAWLLGGGALGRWDYVGYGALASLPIFGPWIAYLINGPTPFGILWSWVDPVHQVRRGVLADAAAQTLGAAFMVASFLLPGSKPPGRREGFELRPNGVAWTF